MLAAMVQVARRRGRGRGVADGQAQGAQARRSASAGVHRERAPGATRRDTSTSRRNVARSSRSRHHSALHRLGHAARRNGRHRPRGSRSRHDDGTRHRKGRSSTPCPVRIDDSSRPRSLSVGPEATPACRPAAALAGHEGHARRERACCDAEGASRRGRRRAHACASIPTHPRSPLAARRWDRGRSHAQRRLEELRHAPAVRAFRGRRTGPRSPQTDRPRRLAVIDVIKLVCGRCGSAVATTKQHDPGAEVTTVRYFDYAEPRARGARRGWQPRDVMANSATLERGRLTRPLLGDADGTCEWDTTRDDITDLVRAWCPNVKCRCTYPGTVIADQLTLCIRRRRRSAKLPTTSS